MAVAVAWSALLPVGNQALTTLACCPDSQELNTISGVSSCRSARGRAIEPTTTAAACQPSAAPGPESRCSATAGAAQDESAATAMGPAATAAATAAGAACAAAETACPSPASACCPRAASAPTSCSADPALGARGRCVVLGDPSNDPSNLRLTDAMAMKETAWLLPHLLCLVQARHMQSIFNPAQAFFAICHTG